jgi:hypothetical protein
MSQVYLYIRFFKTPLVPRSFIFKTEAKMNSDEGKYFTSLSVVDEWLSMEHWWNDTARRKLKYWEKNIIQRRWYMNE